MKTPRVGTLYLVGTPIGNLEDITLRALRVLRDVELIAAEDTRVTRRLLQHYEIEKPMLSYHEHSRPGRLRELLKLLGRGKRVALVSDAGMPGVSDPGARLVRACAEDQIPVVVVPGATAAGAALSLSGLSDREFLLVGFLPSRAGARRKALRQAGEQGSAIVCFEAPHRLRESLADIRVVLGNREAICARELTKRFEEVVRGRVSDVIAYFAENEPRGEMTIVIAGARPESAEAGVGEGLKEVRELVAGGLSRSRAVAHVSKWRGVPRKTLYRAALEQEESE
jgi:16S rRNA (cytidine1402-2'-O)-methyltransferase